MLFRDASSMKIVLKVSQENFSEKVKIIDALHLPVLSTNSSQTMGGVSAPHMPLIVKRTSYEEANFLILISSVFIVVLKQ